MTSLEVEEFEPRRISADSITVTHDASTFDARADASSPDAPPASPVGCAEP